MDDFMKFALGTALLILAIGLMRNFNDHSHYYSSCLEQKIEPAICKKIVGE